MKWLPFKITKQEKQAFKEAGEDKSFRSFQIKAIFFAILIIAEIILLWRHYQLLSLFIVIEASLFWAMYARTLQGLKMPASLREKIDTEIEKQEMEQKNALKFRPKVLLFVVLPLILLIIGAFVYISYSANKEREGMAYRINALNQVEQNVAEDKVVGWQTYRNEKHRYEIKYPYDWFMEEATVLITIIRPFKRAQGEYSDSDRDIFFRVLPTKEDQDQYACMYGDDVSPAGNFFCGWLGSYKRLGKVLIGGIEAHIIQTIPDPNYGDSNGYNIVFIKKGGAIYEMHFYSGHKQLEVVNQIISTFRFLE